MMYRFIDSLNLRGHAACRYDTSMKNFKILPPPPHSYLLVEASAIFPDRQFRRSLIKINKT